MNEKKLKWWQIALIIISSIAVALGVTLWIGNVTSLGIFTPASKGGDFHITDFYNAVKRRNINSISDDVVIVSIDQLNRAQTLEIINKVKQLHPSAIGLDFPFVDSVAYHDYILNTIVKDINIVHATVVNQLSNGKFQREYYSFYEKEFPNTQVGFVTMDAGYAWDVIRTFHPFVLSEKEDTIPSMTLALAKLSNPKRAQELLARKHDIEIIDFASRKIEVIPANQLDNDDIAVKILGKVVLIGDTAYAADIRMTPLHEPISGIFIHAYSLQTVLSGSYIKEWPGWIMWGIAFIISILFVFLQQYARSFTYIGNCLIRLGLWILIFLLVWLGCIIFSRYNHYADFTIVISMLAFSSLAFDITYATIGVVKWLMEKNIITKNKKCLIKKSHKQ